MTKYIGVRQLQTDLRKITRQVQAGEEFVVAKHSKPLFIIKPYKPDQTEKGKYALQDLRRLQFRSGMKDASKKIDETVY